MISNMGHTEYIPGDFVIYKGNVCEIMSANNGDKRHSQYSLIQVGKGIESFTLAHERDIEPIPISAQILEKNGWEKGDWCFIKDFLTIVPHENKAKGFSFSVYGGKSRYNFKYIHELQHILWALGMDDDLKI